MPSHPIGIGEYERVVAKRVALVANLSPAAKHAHFPRLFARPMPPPPLVDIEEREEIKRLRSQNTILKAQVSGLEAKVELLETLQMQAAVHLARKITVRDGFPKASINRIIDIVARHYEVDPANLRAACRISRFVRPRQAAYRLLSEKLNLSFPNIGRCFNRDHTTVMHGLHSARRLFENDVDWRRRYDAARAEIEQSAETDRAGAP